MTGAEVHLTDAALLTANNHRGSDGKSNGFHALSYKCQRSPAWNRLESNARSTLRVKPVFSVFSHRSRKQQRKLTTAFSPARDANKEVEETTNWSFVFYRFVFCQNRYEQSVFLFFYKHFLSSSVRVCS